jgi:DivIVA domain-containing protein
MALSDSSPHFLSPEFIRSVRFTKLRRGGYDVQEVDSFLRRFVELLLEAEETGKTPQDSSTSELYDPEGAAQRLLAAAQRTADAVTKEATIQAEQLVASAEAQADNIRRVVVEEARQLAEQSQDALHETLDQLNVKKRSLEERCAYLEGQLNAGKDQLLTIIDDMRQTIEDSELSLPITEDEELDDVMGFTTVAGSDSEAIEIDGAPEIAMISDDSSDQFSDHDVSSSVEPISEMDNGRGNSIAVDLSLVHSTEDLESWIDAAAAGAEEEINKNTLENQDDDIGPPTQIVPITNDGTSTSGDRFFEELRDSNPHKSVLGLVDDETDAAISAFLSTEED